MSVENWVLAAVGAAIVLGGGGYRDLDDALTGVSTPLSRPLMPQQCLSVAQEVIEMFRDDVDGDGQVHALVVMDRDVASGVGSPMYGPDPMSRIF